MALDEYYLNLSDVCERYRVSRTTVWRWVKDGRLPGPIAMSPQTRRWRLGELIEFENRLSDSPAP